MKLGSSRQRDRKRKQRRFFLVLLKWLFLVGLIIAAGAYAWVTGSKVAQREAIALRERTTELESEVGDLQTAVAEGLAREAVLEEQLPSTTESRLLDAARARVREGVSIDRLTEVVSAATASRACDNDPSTRRFRVQTPVSGGDGTTAAFAGNTITVSATGASARDAEGRPEAWFDPAEPIRLTFTHINGAISNVDGVLPLTHSIAVGSNQYRFQVSEGPRSFISVTMDRCDYP